MGFVIAALIPGFVLTGVGSPLATGHSPLSAGPNVAPVLVLAAPSQREKTKSPGRTLKFETYTDAKGEYRWRLRAGNGQVIATSGQGYKDKRDRTNAIERIKKDARTLKFEQYADAGGGLRWRLIASNGQIIATSGQAYKDKRDCANAIDVIKNGARAAKIEEAKSAE